MPPRRKKKRKPLGEITRPLRRSLYLPTEIARAVLAQAKLEERRPSDMLRILIQRGLRISQRGVPPAE